MFFVAPVDRARLVMKVGDSVAMFFLVPYVAFPGAILAWSFGDIRHGIAHSVVLGLFARLVVQVRVVAGPQLPFSQPQRKGGFSGAVFTATIVGTIAIAGVLPVILGVAYSAMVPLVATVVILAVGSAVMARAGARRIRARVEALRRPWALARSPPADPGARGGAGVSRTGRRVAAGASSSCPTSAPAARAGARGLPRSAGGRRGP